MDAADTNLAAQLVEANERLIIAALNAQTDVETAERALQTVSRSAELDTLTRLPNRALLLDRLAHAIAVAERHGTRLALLFLDLNNFKQINDTLGHAVGDAVLRLAARSLSASVRDADTVSRYGGDEFLILLAEISQTSDAVMVANKVIATLKAQEFVGEHTLSLTASIGISIYPQDGEDADTLINCADAAMYRAKKQGLGSFAFHGHGSTGEQSPSPPACKWSSQAVAEQIALAEDERGHTQPADLRELVVVPNITNSIGAKKENVFQAKLREAKAQLYVACDAVEARVGACEQELAHLRTHDQLTGLANRMLLSDRLQQAIDRGLRLGRRLAIVYIGLDRFKYINENFGAASGDEVLQESARRLRAELRSSDTAARAGSDEFVLVFELENAVCVEASMARILTALREPFQLGTKVVTITSSIGCSLYPDDGDAADELLRRAHAALHNAKRQGRDIVSFFTPGLESSTTERVELETDLRRAVARGELVLYYQPQMDLRTGRRTGFEALLRWRHPSRGMILPDQFIPIAEDSMLIVTIGQWVLRTACQQARIWQQAGIEGATVAVNLGARQFRDASIVETVSQVLADTGLEPSRLELEITESTIMHDIDQVIAIMSKFTALGVMLSIDDFGTGYSSLNYLRRFSVDKLKIDRSFVHDVEKAESAAAVARAVILIGHSLGLKVIAEGVETIGQAEFLLGNKCDEIQGFLIGRPQSAVNAFITVPPLPWAH